MRKYLPLLFLCIISYKSSLSGGVLNDGATIVIAGSTSMYIAGGTSNGNYLNQTNTTNGSIDLDGDLYVEGNWTNNATGGNVFTNVDADGTVRLNGAAVQTIGGSRATFFENLNLTSADKTLGVTGSSVKGTLTVDAVLNLNSKTLIIDNSATTAITVVSDYINSETTDGLSVIQWNTKAIIGTYVVPFKKAGVDVSISEQITASTETGAGTGNITFYTYPTDVYNKPFPLGGMHVSPGENAVDRFWGVTASGYTSLTSNIILHYVPAEVSSNAGLAEADLFMQRWNPATSGWQTGGGSATAGSDLVTRNAVTAHGVMILSKSTSPLPIELTAFEANCIDDNKKTEIKWTTASETNNNFFTIEKSYDGSVYENLAEIPSQDGNSTIEQNYSYIDAVPYNGITYYRLKQTDYNGDSEISNAVTTDCVYDTEYPEVYNISYHSESGDITFDMSSPVGGVASYYVSCYDVKGDRLVQERVSLSKGQTSVSLGTRQLNRGIYFVSFMNETYSGAKKFIVH